MSDRGRNGGPQQAGGRGSGGGRSAGRRSGGQGAGSPRTHAQPARRVALDVLTAVRESDAYANLLLPTRIARAGLSSADAGLATEEVTVRASRTGRGARHVIWLGTRR